MNKSFVLPLSVLAFLVAGCGPASHENDCGAGCRDVVADVVADAGTDTSDDVWDASLGDAPVEVIDTTPGHDCLSCSSNVDCGTGYECQIDGSIGYCQRYCVDDGDCVSGYTCNQSAFPSVCRPDSYVCYLGCIHEYSCDQGMCCDFYDSRCKECKQECQVCQHDYDCASGLRCHLAEDGLTGKCVPECADDICPDSAHQTCTDNGKGVMMCVPDEGYCPGCNYPTPFQLPDGSCVECLDSYDCEGDTCCDDATHTCEMTSWATGCMFCEKCVCSWCCSDEDCVGYSSGTGLCLPDGTCEGVLPCGGLCTPDFPICAVVQGVEQCVQCKVDEDCQLVSPNCVCAGDPTYSCVESDGAICGSGPNCSAMCAEDLDCPPAYNGNHLMCRLDDGGGLCYDPVGTCDGSSACCAPGQKCFDVTVLIGYLQGQEIETTGSGTCECSPDNPCISTKPCTDLSILCTDEALVAQLGLTFAQTCPDGQLSSALPAMICAEVADIVAAVPVPSTYMSF
jgi:hypothetical protein